MPAAGPYWTPWDLANLQQQQQGLQPLADYGQAQLAVALADRQRQQRMEDQARQIFLTFGRQAALAREAERARASEAAAERTFRGGEGALERTSREKIAGEAAQRYADLFRHQDEAANRKSAEARMQYLRKLGYKPKDGEDIDEFEARALKEEQDKDDAEIDAMRGHYDQTKTDLLDVTRKLEADRQKSFNDAGELAVKSEGGLNDKQLKEMKSKGFKNFLSALDTSNPAKAAELRATYARAFDAHEQRYKPPIDLRDKEVDLRKEKDTMERVVLPGLLRTKRDTTRFYQGGENPGSPARPTYNSTVQSFLGDKGLIGGGGGRIPATTTGATGDFSNPDAIFGIPAAPSKATNFGLPDRLTFDDFQKFTKEKLSGDQATAAVNAYYKAIGRRFGFPSTDYYGGSTVARGSILGDAQAAAARQMFKDHPELEKQLSDAFKADPNLESDLYKSALIEATRTPREDRGGDFFGNPVESTFGIPAYKPRPVVAPAPAAAPVLPPMFVNLARAPISATETPSVFPYNPYIPLMPYR